MKNVTEVLSQINSGHLKKKDSSDEFIKLGFEMMTVDVNAAEFLTGCRYEIQDASIPDKKTGNLKKFAGNVVEVICTTIVQGGGARINFWIREKK